MPLLGAHMSIAGGLHKAVEAAAALGMETVQVFTHSPSQWAVKPIVPAAQASHRAGKSLTRNNKQWRARPITDEESQRFRDALRNGHIEHSLSHSSYLLNLASPEPDLWNRSVEGLVAELQRAEQLGIPFVVVHPGARREATEEEGIAAVIEALRQVFQKTKDLNCGVLLETTAGQGSSLGHTFEQLAAILDGLRRSSRLGICVDTCHVFAAGYPLADRADYLQSFRAFDRLIGLEQIRAFHLNDSQRELGSRVDRHEHIGRGKLGLAPFRHLLNDRLFRDIPMYLETAKGTERGEDLDVINLRTLRTLVGSRRRSV